MGSKPLLRHSSQHAEAIKQAAAAVVKEWGGRGITNYEPYLTNAASRGIRAAYPIIRAAVVAEVVEALRGADVRENVDGDFALSAAHFIEREFGTEGN